MASNKKQESSVRTFVRIISDAVLKVKSLEEIEESSSADYAEDTDFLAKIGD